jgi:hypothetical protein
MKAAEKLARLLANAERPTEQAVTSLAAKLQIPLTVHEVVLARASEAAARITRALAQVQGRGHLQFFNAEYKRRRLAAQAAGKGFMSYAQARARLQREIADAGASGERVLLESSTSNRMPLGSRRKAAGAFFMGAAPCVLPQTVTPYP